MSKRKTRIVKRSTSGRLLVPFFDAIAERAAMWAEALPTSLIDEMHAARASVAYGEAMREQLALRLRGRRALNGAEWLPGIELAASAARVPATLIVPPERLHA